MFEDDKYKIIIIGAGIKGLSTGIAWTKLYDTKENPVLIIEKQPVVGGCVATFAREDYRFDTVQIIPDVSDVMRFLGININLLKFENCYARLFLANPKEKNVKIFNVAPNVEAFKKYLVEKFSTERKKIFMFFDYCIKMHEELNYLKTEPKWNDVIRILFNCPKILSNSNKTYKQFLKKFDFKNAELYEILDVFSSFSGLSGNRCASLLTACAMITTLKGSYRPVQGFIQLPLCLKKEFENNGGKVLLRTGVKKILVESGKVLGVELDDGRIIHSEIVVSTADSKVTLGEMVGYDIVKRINSRYAKKIENAVMSPSGFAINIGLDDEMNLKEKGFDCGYNVLTTGHSAHEKMFDYWERNEIYLSENEFHLAVISPSVLIGGKPNLIIHVVPVPAEPWISLRKNNYEKYLFEKNKLADFYIRKVEEYMIPDLRKHIKFIDVSTPATYTRYISSPTGSNYDMMPVPDNFGKNRLKTRTPIKNLFLPKFSHGIWPSMQAGLQVVDMISEGKIMNGNSSYSEKEKI